MSLQWEIINFELASIFVRIEIVYGDKDEDEKTFSDPDPPRCHFHPQKIKITD